MEKENICKNCGSEMPINQEWDVEFDRLDRTIPDYIIIIKNLANRDIPKFICKNCGNEVIVDR